MEKYDFLEIVETEYDNIFISTTNTGDIDSLVSFLQKHIESIEVVTLNLPTGDRYFYRLGELPGKEPGGAIHFWGLFQQAIEIAATTTPSLLSQTACENVRRDVLCLRCCEFHSPVNSPPT